MVDSRRVTVARARPSLPARGRNPRCRAADGERSASVKTGWIVTSAADGAAVVIGHLPARLEPESWASPGPAVKRKPTVDRAARFRDATKQQAARHASH